VHRPTQRPPKQKTQKKRRTLPRRRFLKTTS
jgi:hypothetical protein